MRPCKDFDFVPDHVRSIMAAIHEGGFQVWLVGGALRDLFLGLKPKDWDLATTASAPAVMGMFPRVIPVGLSHGTVTVHREGCGVEVTCLGGLEGLSMEKDLERRDFTFNAMAILYPSGELLDPFMGMRDLQEGTVRAVVNPHGRFREDPVRILRAARFMGALDFQIDPETRAGVASGLAGAHAVAAERVRDEMVRILLTKRASRALEWLRRVKALEWTMPELAATFVRGGSPRRAASLYRQSLLTLSVCPFRLPVRLAAVTGQLGKLRTRRRCRGERGTGGNWKQEGASQAVKIMERWRMSRRDMRRVEMIIERQLTPQAVFWSMPRLRKALAHLEKEVVQDVVDLALARAFVLKKSARERKKLWEKTKSLMENDPPLKIKDLQLTGEDVMRHLSMKPGPMVGNVLHAMHGMVLKNPSLNNRETLEILMKKYFFERARLRETESEKTCSMRGQNS